MEPSDRSNSTTLHGEKRSKKMDCVRRAWSEIQAALARGESLISIHSRLQGAEIPADYHTFATYVNRLRKAEKTPRAKENLATVNKGGRSPACIPIQLELAIRAEAIIERTELRRCHVHGTSKSLPENRSFRTVNCSARNVYMHTVITAGQAQDDTLGRFQQVTENTETDRQIVVWANDYFGPIECDEKPFFESALYQDSKNKIAGLISFRRRNPDTFGHDVDVMISHRQTFEEAIQTEGTYIAAKHRLQMLQKDLYEQLDHLLAPAGEQICEVDKNEDRNCA